MSGNYLYMFVGESGSGKSTIEKRVCEDFGFENLKSFTTRKCRGGDDYCTHIFTDEDFYVSSKSSGQIIAETFFCGNYYWSTIDQIESSDTYTIDPKGIEYFKSIYKGNKIPIIIYITVSPIRRFFRMIRRGDGVIKSIKRINNDRKEFKGFDYNMKIINKDLEKSVNAVENYIRGHLFS